MFLFTTSRFSLSFLFLVSFNLHKSLYIVTKSTSKKLPLDFDELRSVGLLKKLFKATQEKY